MEGGSLFSSTWMMIVGRKHVSDEDTDSKFGAPSLEVTGPGGEQNVVWVPVQTASHV